RFVASRATVGGVGMVCILFVTILTFVPLPSVWPDADAVAVRHASSTDHRSVDKLPTPQADELNSNASSSSGLTVAISFSKITFQKIGGSLQHATAAVSTTPNWLKTLLLLLVLLSIAGTTVHFLLSLRAVEQLYRTSLPLEDQRLVMLTARLRRRCR